MFAVTGLFHSWAELVPGYQKGEEQHWKTENTHSRDKIFSTLPTVYFIKSFYSEKYKLWTVFNVFFKHALLFSLVNSLMNTSGYYVNSVFQFLYQSKKKTYKIFDSDLWSFSTFDHLFIFLFCFFCSKQRLLNYTKSANTSYLKIPFFW